ncbi:hypothetical protein SDC9_65281 [bioreactor metagenome]|uniref:NAD-specific glutamate dehydrogenase n=1 Tax=bioreactor metagenome TaxID=1076179 RepID=A0A644XXT3_9ZZZZ
MYDFILHEHIEAVAAALQHIVMGGQGIGLGKVQRHPTHLHVGHAVRAVHAHEITLFVSHHGGFDGGVDGIGEARDLEETAVGLRRQAGSHFKGVQYLLASGFHRAGHISEGVYVDDVTVGNIAGGNAHADSAAVHKGDIRAQKGPVSVGTQITQIGLLGAHAGGALAVERHRGFGHDLLQVGGKEGLNVFDIGIYFSVFSGVVGNKLRCDGAVLGQDQLSDGGELRAGGGEDDFLSVLVRHLVAGNHAVRVAVDKRVNAGGVRDHVGGTPRGALFVDTQMSNRDDIIGAFGLGGIYGSLYGVIQVGTVFPLAEAVDIVSVCVLEIGRSGFCEGLRRGDSHIGNFGVAVGDDLIGVKDRLFGGEALKIAGDDRGLLHAHQLERAGHAVVKLVVAESHYIIAHLVHDIHKVGTF